MKAGQKRGNLWKLLSPSDRRAEAGHVGKDIELWEEKAKQGLLKMMLYSAVHCSKDEKHHGRYYRIRRIIFHRDKHRQLERRSQAFYRRKQAEKAIEENPDRVMEIFARQSSISYDPDNSREDRKTRYDESGVVERLFDVIQNYIRTTRNNDGKKGLLLEKAGIIGDVTEFQNTISKEINIGTLYTGFNRKTLYQARIFIYKICRIGNSPKQDECPSRMVITELRKCTEVNDRNGET